MMPPDPAKSVAAEAGPAAEARPGAAAIKPATAPLSLLDGDEIIQLSIKPSVWYIPLVSLNFGATALLAGIGLYFAMRGGVLAESALPFQVLIAAAAVRLGLATLQWASRLYVLTNRRVMRFKGVLNVDVAQLRLSDVGRVDVQAGSLARALRLGTLQIASAEEKARPCIWREVARPLEVHEILVRAVRKAQSRE